MAFFVVRVWLPDRPGALGAVASRIGAVRGDLVGIDILERGAGRAIDELVVDLPSESLVDLLLSEIAEVDGVDVEDVRRAGDALVDPRLDALEAAVVLVTSPAVEPLLARLASSARRDFTADWSAVLDRQARGHAAVAGPAPAAPWLDAFLAGNRAGPGSDDVAWADLDAAGLVLVLGRQGRPLRARERRQLTALARIGDARWAELAGPQARARSTARLQPS